MPIAYAKFNVSLHGLNLTSAKQLEALEYSLKQAVEECHPEMATLQDSDVEIELKEFAGVAK